MQHCLTNHLFYSLSLNLCLLKETFNHLICLPIEDGQICGQLLMTIEPFYLACEVFLGRQHSQHLLVVLLKYGRASCNLRRGTGKFQIQLVACVLKELEDLREDTQSYMETWQVHL